MSTLAADSPAPIPHRNLPLLLLQARECVIARFRPVLNEHGVTEQQWRIIRAVLERGPMEPREIVLLCQISSPSLTGILARMDEAGWVRREKLDHDQRRVRVSLTEQSQRLAQQLAPRIEAVYAALESQLGVDFTTEFYRTLDRLIASLNPENKPIAEVSTGTDAEPGSD